MITHVRLVVQEFQDLIVHLVTVTLNLPIYKTKAVCQEFLIVKVSVIKVSLLMAKLLRFVLNVIKLVLPVMTKVQLETCLSVLLVLKSSTLEKPMNLLAWINVLQDFTQLLFKPKEQYVHLVSSHAQNVVEAQLFAQNVIKIVQLRYFTIVVVLVLVLLLLP